MSKRSGSWMQTYTGRQFWPLDPRPDEIDIDDIAHALAYQCRYSGHTHRFYSVAEHCCAIADNAPPTDALWGLLHDASEAYLADVIRPIKPFLTGYREIEARLMRCICDAFQLQHEQPSSISALDGRILVNEREQLMACPPVPWEDTGTRIDGLILECWTPEVAELEFLVRFYSLWKMR